MKFYFFFKGLKALPLHFLHFTLPARILRGSDLILLWQFLHTNTFLKSLFVASNIFAILFL